MFIQTEATANPNSLRFLPGRTVLASGMVAFSNAADSARSPLARNLFDIDGVAGVRLEGESVLVDKRAEKDWQLLKPLILGTIMDHFVGGHPVLLEEQGEDDPLVAQIRELIDTRIRPAVRDGGAVRYHDFKDGIVYLELEGAAVGLLAGIENMLRHYVPEIQAVKDHRDAQPKPGLETPEGIAVREILDQRINPSVAAHGGHISLVDVQDDTVYIRLEGGCQGCGMANVTLKQGVEVEIKRAVPSITQVLDTTDHAGGNNPYFQPGKDGMSPY